MKFVLLYLFHQVFPCSEDESISWWLGGDGWFVDRYMYLARAEVERQRQRQGDVTGQSEIQVLYTWGTRRNSRSDIIPCAASEVLSPSVATAAPRTNTPPFAKVSRTREVYGPAM